MFTFQSKMCWSDMSVKQDGSYAFKILNVRFGVRERWVVTISDAKQRYCSGIQASPKENETP